MKKMLGEFKEFAFKGNVLDMAVGVVIGAAFGKIVSSVVNDLIMPIIGFLTGGMNYTTLKVILNPAVTNGTEVVKPEVAIMYGNFIQSTIDFLIIAFCIFIFIRAINKMRSKKAVEVLAEAPAPAAPAEDIVLLTEIRDLLKQK